MKTILRILCCGFFSLALAAGLNVHAAATNELPKFEDLLKLLRENGAMSPSELDRAATEGLLTRLRGQITLLTNSAPSNVSAEVLSKSTNYDNGFAYFRVGQVKDDLAGKIQKEFLKMSKLKGMVIDLRFADGDDYAAAAKVADLFLEKSQPLLNWGGETVHSTAKTNSIDLPVAVLVNGETGGAAEALAAVLHETQVALLIGSPTVGSANIYKDFTLANGQRVRVATAQVKVGDGKPLPPTGLKPDIAVSIDPADEKAYFADPYKSLAKATNEVSGTNTVGSLAKTNQPRLNEAELVRQHKEGFDLRDEVVEKPREMDAHAMTDPVLVRALDLLKGLAVVHQSRR